MKKIFSLLIVSLTIFAGALLTSCGNTEPSPVDKYLEILEKATVQAEKITSLSELANVQSVVSQEEARELIENAKDYKLTSSDKEKLKKATDKLLRIAFEKSIEFSNLPDGMKASSKAQIDMAIDAANSRIDEAKTLGEISGMR